MLPYKTQRLTEWLKYENGVNHLAFSHRISTQINTPGDFGDVLDSFLLSLKHKMKEYLLEEFYSSRVPETPRIFAKEYLSYSGCLCITKSLISCNLSPIFIATTQIPFCTACLTQLFLHRYSSQDKKRLEK